MSLSRPLENVIDGDAAMTADVLGASPPGLYIRCHENEVPPFADAELQRLYGNLFSSLAYGRIFGGVENASAYVLHDGDAIAGLWLFRHEGRTLRVINEGMRVERDDLIRFANHCFSRYPSVQLISFHAVQAQRWRLPMPSQHYNCLEDMVLTLPRSQSAYLASLGKSTRSYVQRYLNKLRRDFPDFRFQALAAHQVQAPQIQQIIELNRSRMHDKGKVSINDDWHAQRITRLAMECGLVGIITIDDRICAGVINYRIGDNYFLDVLAHDPAFNDYRVGTLCCYLTICECIARGGKEYHFLWGQDDYKSRLGGVRRDLNHLTLYRSRMHMLLNGATVLRNLHDAWERKIRLRMRDARRGHSGWARMLAAMLKGWRRIG